MMYSDNTCRGRAGPRGATGGHQGAAGLVLQAPASGQKGPLYRLGVGLLVLAGFIAVQLAGAGVALADASLSLTKSGALSGGGIPHAGDTINYTFKVDNTGTETLSNVLVSDSKVPTITCGLIPNPIPTMLVTSSRTCTGSYTVTQADMDAGKVDNIATAAETATGGTSTQGSTMVPLLQVTALTLVKSADRINYNEVGQVINYTYLVMNMGNVTVSGPFTIDDDKATDESCPPIPATLAPGESTTCIASHTVVQQDLDGGEIKNTATAFGTNPNGGEAQSNPSSVTIPALQNPALSIAKTASPMSYDTLGQKIGYSYAVTNTGNVTITGPITVSDDKASDESCPGGNLAPGATRTCTASYTITQADLDGGAVTNTATASGKDPHEQTVTSPTDQVTVTALQSPTLSIVKSASPTTYDTLGQKIGYSYAVTNEGNVTISGPITVSDDKASDESCPPGDLAPDAMRTCSATYTITQADLDGGAVTNVASASGKAPGGQTVTSPTDTVTVTAVQSPALSIVKSASPMSYDTLGQKIGYSYLVTNEGNVTISGPINVSDDRASDESCPPGDLAPGGSLTCSASHTIAQADLNAGSVTNVASASGKDPGGQTVTSPTDTVTVTAVQRPELTLDKTATPQSYDRVGQAISYKYKLTNSGNVNIAGPIQVADDLIASVNCPLGDLAPSAFLTCSASYRIDQDDLDGGSVVNTASASGKDPGGQTVTSPTDTVTVTAVQKAALKLVKSASPDSFQNAGDVIDYEFQVSNTGNVTVNGLSVSDTLPIMVACPETTLAPSQGTTCTASYTVQPADQEACVIENLAQASGDAPNGLVQSNPDSVSVFFRSSAQEPFGLTRVEKAAFAVIEGLLGSTAAAVEATPLGCATMAGFYRVSVEVGPSATGAGSLDGLSLSVMLDPTHIGSGGFVDGGVSVRGEIFTVDQIGAGLIKDVDIANFDGIYGYDSTGGIMWGGAGMEVDGDSYGKRLIKDFWEAPPTPENGCTVGQINDEGLEAITKLQFPRSKWYQWSDYNREDGAEGAISWTKTQIAPYGGDLCQLLFTGQADLQGHGFHLTGGLLQIQPAP